MSGGRVLYPKVAQSPVGAGVLHNSNNNSPSTQYRYSDTVLCGHEGESFVCNLILLNKLP